VDGPICLGHYPKDGLKLYEQDMPPIKEDDMKTIHQKLDFIGLNIYSGDIVSSNKDGSLKTIPFKPGQPMTTLHWAVLPKVMYWGVRFFAKRYQLPIIITENGFSALDHIALDGKVHDSQRIDFTTQYLKSLHTAIQEGIDVKGYFHWSFMDNFEWAEGYRERFGLIYVDYPSQKRILKDSAFWYQDIIKTNGGALFN